MGEQNTPHFQGYVCFNKQKELSALKKMIVRAHWEPMRGTPKQASNYCKEDGKYLEVGTLPDSGGASGGLTKSINYKRILEQIMQGKKNEVMDEEPGVFLRHYSTIRRIEQDYPIKPPDLPAVCGEWIYGEPGLGKSHLARKENPSHYLKAANKWWDGYRNESAAIIDDFDKSHYVLGHHLKLWADKWCFPAEIKGTTVQLRPQKIIITSNYSIEEIWEQDVMMQEAIRRRFNVRHIIKPLF